MCQLVAGPILGRLSDRFGRRPVLAISQFGTAVSFVILALSTSFPMMLLGRMLDGASGGNILVAQAYVADVTKPEHRSRSLGLIGAAFGIGFVLGPLLGGFLVELPVAEGWRLRLPFLVAAGFSTIAWILVLTSLPESLSKDGPRTEARVLSWRGVADTLSDGRVGGLVTLGGLTTLAFAALEGTFSEFLGMRMGLKPREAAYSFAGLGFVSACIQGGLIRRLVPRFGEPRLILAGIAISAAGFATMANVWNAPMLVLAILLTGIGTGLTAPSVQGLLSKSTPASEQGAVFGTLTSAQTLARMINYALGGYLLAKLGPSGPYWEAAGVALLALGLAVAVVRRRVVEPVASGA